MSDQDDEIDDHRSMKPLSRPPELVWLRMSTAEREAWIAVAREYEQQLEDERRKRYLRRYGY